ncbi:MAG TPA: hypothetical protein VF595_15775 [Tepidisphaeraceae bacterium]
MENSHTIILDGFLGRPRRWERLRRLIELRAGPASIFQYESTGLTPIPTLGQRLIDEIRGRGGRVNLVGFSMGGMVIRAAHLIDPALPTRRAVFMNSPHLGTWLAHLVPTPGVRQMRPGDPFVKAIADAPWTVPTLTVWNGFDGIILPPRSTRYRYGGEHVCCPVPLHIWPVWSRTIHRRIADFLAAPEADVDCLHHAASRYNRS